MKKIFVLKKIEILPEKSANPIYNELESKAHTAYEAEKTVLYLYRTGRPQSVSAIPWTNFLAMGS